MHNTNLIGQIGLDISENKSKICILKKGICRQRISILVNNNRTLEVVK